MKKTLKIVIPILVIVALLAAGYWFFFQYRVDVTTGLLKNFAGSQFDSGNYDLAIRCYRWADGLAPGDPELALKLAETYRRSGNYTKTESTLVNAIYDSPAEPRLYAALCQVYVEQDKLLDAQELLDNISNPQARDALTSQRPAAPTVSPRGDFYDEYITVTVTASAGTTCCYTSDGSYPSLSGGGDGSLRLPAGTTTIRAVAVGSSGLVSPLVTERFTVAGVVEDVTFHDQVLRDHIAQLLNRGSRAIRTDDLWGIEELVLPAGITDTTDLALFTGLKKLVILDQGPMDYSFLEAMTALEYLELESCALEAEDLTEIGGCTSLTTLILADCGLTNVSALSGLQGLRVLDLSENSIGTVAHLQGMNVLEELYLGHNALTALPVMRTFKSLRILDLSYNAIPYVSSISACTSLERLNLSHNDLTSVTPLSALTKLIWLDLSANELTDLSPLTPCVNLEYLLATDNYLVEADFLSNCPKLREVYLDYNDLTAAPLFQPDCPLETFSASHNFLVDIDGLAGLQSLVYVNAEYNNISSINVLKDCPALTTVNVYNTNVHSGGILEENGVTVNYTPGF